jgi:hypothetical protein
MKVTFVENPTPHLLLENIFTDKEMNLIWSEINFLHPNFQDPKNTSGAELGNKIIKKNSGIFLYEVFKTPFYSNIIKSLHSKVYNNIFLKEKWAIPWIKKSFEICNWDTALVSYYDDSDYYDSHGDKSVFTTLLWIWKEPKSFEGGEFHFDSYSHNVKVNNNCGIIFLSTELHSVSPIKILERNFENCGRYCITSFCGLGLSQ